MFLMQWADKKNSGVRLSKIKFTLLLLLACFGSHNVTLLVATSNVKIPICEKVAKCEKNINAKCEK